MLAGLSLCVCLLSSGCSTKRVTAPVQAACVRPTETQGNSIALLLELGSGMTAEGRLADVWIDELLPAAEWVAGVYGRCWGADGDS